MSEVAGFSYPDIGRFLSPDIIIQDEVRPADLERLLISCAIVDAAVHVHQRDLVELARGGVAPGGVGRVVAGRVVDWRPVGRAALAPGVERHPLDHHDRDGPQTAAGRGSYRPNRGDRARGSRGPRRRLLGHLGWPHPSSREFAWGRGSAVEPSLGRHRARVNTNSV